MTSPHTRPPEPALIAAGPVASQVAAAAETRLPSILDDLRRWVGRDSPSGDHEALDGLAGELATAALAMALEPKLIPSAAGAHLHARRVGTGTARVALLCHHDTVFPRGTAAARPYRADGDLVRGPGVADMKGGLAVALHVAGLLTEAGDPFGVLEVVSVPDEEPRASPPATLDRLAGFDAVLCLECGRPDGAVVSTRKGGRWPRLLARGRAAHAGVAPEMGRNAVLALSSEALRIATLDGAREGLTVHVTRLHGGEVVNAIPGEATLDVDVRGVRTDDLEWAMERIAAVSPHAGVVIRVEAVGGTPPLERDRKVGLLAEAAGRLGAELGTQVGETTTGGVSDACWSSGAGLPTLDGLGPVGGDDHGPDEWIDPGSIPVRCGIVAGLVAAVEAGLLDPAP